MSRRFMTCRGVTKAEILGIFTALVIAACSPPQFTQHTAPTNAALPREVRLDQPPGGPPRYFQTSIDEAFWVSHSSERDRVVSMGMRLELSAKTGEVLAASWEIDNELKSDVLIGALEVAPRLGGGFIHWSRNQLFHSETFSGPLRPITTKHVLGAEAIRGARNGLEGVVVFGESANAQLVGSKKIVDPPPFAGLVDFAALDDKRAIRTDVLGRVHTTIDGGKTWVDVTNTVGIAQKQLLVEPELIHVQTWQGRWQFNADGTVGPLEVSFVGARRGLNYSMIFKGSRLEEQNAWWAWREIAPVQAAVLGGARSDAQHVLGFAAGTLGEVDLATGELSRAITDWPQAGLSCSLVSDRAEPLFICGWDSYQGYGAYVMRMDHGAWPPRIERSFTDDGYFVTDDHGALAFVGSCNVTPKYVDPNDMSRFDTSSDSFRVATKICVRRSSSEWIEHEIEVDADSMLQAWAPKRDGTAVALVVRKETTPMPDRTDDPTRVTTQGGVRIVRVPRDVSGFGLAKPNWSPYGAMGRAPSGPTVERRVQVQDDGTIRAWFSAQNNTDPSSGLHAGVRIDTRGELTLHPPPPRAMTMIATGQYGIALLNDGTLVETLDHGGTYRAGGLSPIPVNAFSGYCSMLGCVLGSVTRLGWGAPATNPVVDSVKLEVDAAPRSSTKLECSMTGMPDVIDDKSLHRGNRQTWLTGFGDVTSLIREVENVADAVPQVQAQAPDPDDPPPANIVAPPKKSLRAPTRTQSLLFRAPFDPDALPRPLDATSSQLENVRRLGVIPLLGKDGDTGLLFISDKHELLLFGDELTTLPLFETRRYMSDDARNAPGLMLGPNEAVVLADVRRRSTLEEHGIGTQRAPIFLGTERDSSARKPMALARRDDGVQGLVIWEGSPPQVAAVAELDTKSRTFLPFSPLASWTTATMGDDPRCKNLHGWSALVPIDPTLWFDLKAFVPSGVELSTMGMLLVRWNAERVCVDALDVGVESRSAYDFRYDNRLVMRWVAAGKKRRGGVLLHDGTKRKVECKWGG